jgi:predicted nucleic acid-binding protein
MSAALRIGSLPNQALLNRWLPVMYAPARKRWPSWSSFVALIRRHVHLLAVQDVDREAVEPPCRDPKDNQFLALALAAEADALVSSDEDLLVLHPWRGIAIVTPAEFLAKTEVPQ